MLLSNRAFSRSAARAASRVVKVWPVLAEAASELAEELRGLSLGETLKSLTAPNDTEVPSFFALCDSRKYKLALTYGLSYHRHHGGIFCGAARGG